MALSDRSIALTAVVVGIAFGIGGIISGYYFYEKSIRERLPVVSVDPVRASIVNSADLSDLTILYHGAPIRQTSVTSLRIYFWNRGDLPIIKAAHDILRQIQFHLPSGSEIIDKRVLKVSRGEVEFSASIPQDARNVLNVDFEILEKNDGAAIQIIYAGAPDAEIEATGTIVGTEGVQIIKNYASRQEMPLIDKIKTTPMSFRAIIVLFTIIAVYFLGVVLTGKYFRWADFRSINIGFLLILVLLTIHLLFFRPWYLPLGEVPQNHLSQ